MIREYDIVEVHFPYVIFSQFSGIPNVAYDAGWIRYFPSEIGFYAKLARRGYWADANHVRFRGKADTISPPLKCPLRPQADVLRFAQFRRTIGRKKGRKGYTFLTPGAQVRWKILSRSNTGSMAVCRAASVM